VLILIEYPQLLRGGMNRWFRSPGGITSSVSPKKEYRSVMVLGANMEMPAAEELKKYLYDWDQAKKKASAARPIIVQLPRALLDDVPAPAPKPRQDPPAAANSQPVTPAATAGAAPPSSASAGDAKSATAAGQPPPPVTEPKQIPKGIPTTPPPGSAAIGSAKSNAASTSPTRPSGAETKTAGQQTGVRLQGDVLFDTKGFNLDEYARIVKERCEEHWLIPSNLRTFQGSVTIVFYITKEGQVTGAKIDVSSGNASLDISALTAVWESSLFPPLPRGFPAERVGARLVFAYNER
jgi:TonB family protein